MNLHDHGFANSPHVWALEMDAKAELAQRIAESDRRAESEGTQRRAWAWVGFLLVLLSASVAGNLFQFLLHSAALEICGVRR